MSAKASDKQQKSTYDASQIQVLEGLEPVRKRPGMYIGSTGPEGLHHLVWELIDNGIDEALAGFATQVHVEMLEDGGITVIDNGRGIPTDKHAKTGKSGVETALTILHAGGKFGGGTYKVSGGLHGVGVSVVNALSEKLTATIYQKGNEYRQEFEFGAPKTPLKTVGKSDKNGTEITFYPDTKIFQTTEFDYGIIIDRLRHQAYLTKGVRTSIENRKTGERHAFYFEGGIESYVKHLNMGKEALDDDVFYVEKQIEDVVVEIALQYTDTFSDTVMPFANNVFNPDGGTHLTGFRTALTRVINDYARKNGLL